MVQQKIFTDTKEGSNKETREQKRHKTYNSKKVLFGQLLN